MLGQGGIAQFALATVPQFHGAVQVIAGLLPLEVTLSVSKSQRVQDELVAAIGSSADLMMESVLTVSKSQQAPTEINVGTASSIQLLPIELTSALTADSRTTAEIVATQYGSAVPIEFLSVAQNRQVAQDEITYSVHGSIAARVPLEFLALIKGQAVIMLSWASLILPARIVRNVRKRIRIVYNAMFRAEDEY